MLQHLYIKNFTLIDTLDIDLHTGFSVITGETGAGKSIILGAIALLLGQRADPKAIKQGADKCTIEAHFDLSRYDLQPFFTENDIEYDANDCIIRRELAASGKSRAFINDTPVQLSMLKELGEHLVDVHSQHQNLLLNKQDFQLGVVDIIAKNQQELEKYRQLFTDYQAAEKELAQLRETIARNQQNADFLQFQFSELTSANLQSGELEELEQQSETMTHSEDIKSALFTADNALQAEGTGIVGSLRTALSALRAIVPVFPSVQELTERMDSTYIELKDIAQDLSSQMDDVEFDPAELDRINARLDKLYDLQRKYHVETTDELIAIREELKQKLSTIENSDEALQEQQKKVSQLKEACQKQADILSKQRVKAGKEIEKDMLSRLIPLGMPNVRFSISITKEELSRNGQDKVAFIFSANTSTSLQPISQIASGGEIARVMLSLKAMISGVVKLPTIIFDEIDTGVSGKIAEKMAVIMQEMGRLERQVISITHLPQIAALSSVHYKVSKEETPSGTISRMVELTPEERIQEIAQMLSGSNVTDAAIENAKELLKLK